MLSLLLHAVADDYQGWPVSRFDRGLALAADLIILALIVWVL